MRTEVIELEGKRFFVLNGLIVAENSDGAGYIEALKKLVAAIKETPTLSPSAVFRAGGWLLPSRLATYWPLGARDGHASARWGRVLNGPPKDPPFRSRDGFASILVRRQ